MGIRKRLSEELIAEMNEKIHSFSMEKSSANPDKDKKYNDPPGGEGVSHKGEVIFDATVCPQDIAYPLDIGLLNKAKEISEEIIDELHSSELGLDSPTISH